MRFLIDGAVNNDDINAIVNKTTRRQMERADNGTWFDHSVWNFYADDGFGNLVRVADWPVMNYSSAE